tara:strand:- start:530 stop:1324 length:795 start_codon:yes stop_codon:yes gene_type:complete
MCLSEEVSRLIYKYGVEEVKKEIIGRKVVLPWCGVKCEGKCEGIIYNNGLLTQCENRKEECKKCKEMKYGRVSDRLKSGVMEYVTPCGKRPVEYSKIMKKLNISRTEVELEGCRLNIKIPEIHFEEKKMRGRGRPRKKLEAESESESGSVLESKSSEKRGRGRPRKEKKKIENNGDEIIALLLKENIEESDRKEEMDSDGKEEMDNDGKEEMDNDDEETEVSEEIINGKKYLMTDDKILYDIETHEAIGKWNSIKNIIENYEEE